MQEVGLYAIVDNNIDAALSLYSLGLVKIDKDGESYTEILPVPDRVRRQGFFPAAQFR
jgi:hypothetical protein